MPTASLTALLNEHGITTNVAAYNALLRDAGMLEERTRRSTSAANGAKHFWAVSENRLAYGKNLTNPASPRETLPHWYVDRFGELHRIVTGRLLGNGGTQRSPLPPKQSSPCSRQGLACCTYSLYWMR